MQFMTKKIKTKPYRLLNVLLVWQTRRQTNAGVRKLFVTNQFLSFVPASKTCIHYSLKTASKVFHHLLKLETDKQDEKSVPAPPSKKLKKLTGQKRLVSGKNGLSYSNVSYSDFRFLSRSLSRYGVQMHRCSPISKQNDHKLFFYR